MRRLCTLACLTLVWLLATPTAAFAHCHGSVTFGLMSGIGDCGKAALLAICAVISGAAASVGLFLGLNYYLNQLKLEYYYQLGGLSAPTEDVVSIADNIAKVGEAYDKIRYDIDTPDSVGFVVEWGTRSLSLAKPGLRIGWQWANDVTFRIGRFIGFW